MFTFTTRRDDKVIAQVLAGSHDQFGLLVQRYLPVVQAIAHARVRNSSDVDDVVQETFFKAFQNLDQLRERAKFPAWLAAITRNAATSILNQRSRDAAIADTLPTDAQTQTPDFASREFRAAIRDRIDQLDEDAREVILLFYFADKSCREISKILTATEPAIRKRLQRAREALGAQILVDFKKDDALATFRPERAKHILSAVLASGAAWSKESTALTSGASALAGGTVLTAGFTLGKTLAIGAAVIAVASITLIATRREQVVDSPPPAPQTDSIAEESTSQPEPAERLADSSADDSPALVTEPVDVALDAQPETNTVTTAQTGIPVTGQILHTDGTPVPFANVFASYWGHEPRREKMETTADENGAYTLYLDKPWDMFLVYGEKEGYTRFRHTQVNVPESGADNVNFTLHREATIEGRIVASSRFSVAQKPITAFNHDADNILWTVESESDETGAFTISGLIPGSYSIAIIKEADYNAGMENLRVDVPEGAHLTGIEIPYAGDGLVIAGRVTDEEGNPIKGVFVQATAAQKGWNPRDTYTDDAGNYRLVQLEEGEFPLNASHRKYQYASMMAVAGSENVDFVLRSRGSVSGIVIDARTRQPLTEFSVHATGGAQSEVRVTDERWFKSFFDEQGRFTINDVILDTATIMARADGYTPVLQLVELSSGEHLEGLVIELSAGLAIDGHVVTSAGDPVEGAYIVLGPQLYVPQGTDPDFYANQTAEIAQTISGDDGSFTVRDLAPGSQLISAYHPKLGGGSATAYLPAKPGDDALEIILAIGGGISGTVTLGGALLSDIPIMVTPPGGRGMPVAYGSTDNEGRYELTGVRPGDVSVIAILPTAGDAFGGRRLHQNASVISGQDIVVNLDFAPDYGNIAGRVEVDGVTEFSGSAMCTIPLSDGKEERIAVMRDGQFQFEQIPVGTANLFVTIALGDSSQPAFGTNGLVKIVPVSVALGQTTEVLVRFDGRSDISGTILGVQSTEHGQVMVLQGEIDIPQYDAAIHTELLMNFASAISQTASDATYTIQGLDAGTYTLLAIVTDSNGPNFSVNVRFATTTVTLGAGDAQIADFDLR